ncbi:SDR family oxidoreductase [Clostridium butyricum]|uniref:SDR family NAD(P)-dependent oxidoreductase n=1 Tax=Clostridium butyricum TaxID=1492 RepID=UPI001CA9D463|nr:SDR family oxidoreductase [Clostridium butyricum]MBZ0312900.1 SDR family oxidoreductase [Clostridium butyricum]
MKYAIVTGSTKGIGKAIALKLLNKGFFVYLNFSEDEETALILEKQLKLHYEGMFKVIKKNLHSLNSVKEFCDIILKDTNSLDVLVLNTGITDRSRFEEITEKKWNNIMNVNLNAPFFLVQNLNSFLNRKNGRIIFIGSKMGEVPHAISIAYGVSKAAIHQLSKQLVKEYAGTGITINTIAPGFVETPWQIEKTYEHRKRICDKTAVGRFADPKEIAELCYHVIENNYINGAILNIDGGYDYK